MQQQQQPHKRNADDEADAFSLDCTFKRSYLWQVSDLFLSFYIAARVFLLSRVFSSSSFFPYIVCVCVCVFDEKSCRSEVVVVVVEEVEESQLSFLYLWARGGRQVDESEASSSTFLHDVRKCCNMFQASDALIMRG